VRRAAGVAGAIAATGSIAIVSLIAPFRADRAAARAKAGQPFFEVHVHASLAACERRDPKGLYRRARAGTLPSFTGVDSPYEPPLHPDLLLDTVDAGVEESAAELVAFIDRHTRLHRRDDEHAASA
jgi:adenylylsulfate kinase-like enzyme